MNGNNNERKETLQFVYTLRRKKLLINEFVKQVFEGHSSFLILKNALLCNLLFQQILVLLQGGFANLKEKSCIPCDIWIHIGILT